MNMPDDAQHDGSAVLKFDVALRSPATRNAWLQSNPRAGALATHGEIAREWVFPNGDEVFRSIYTRAGAGFASEVLAICSAIAGEGKTTVGVGLAVALPQDSPDRRVLFVEPDLQQPILADDFGVEPSPGLV